MGNIFDALDSSIPLFLIFFSFTLTLCVDCWKSITVRFFFLIIELIWSSLLTKPFDFSKFIFNYVFNLSPTNSIIFY